MNRTNVAKQIKPYHLLRRSFRQPGIPQPLSVRSVAYAIFSPGEWEDRQYREFAKVMWTVSGSAVVTFGSNDQLMYANQIAVYFPNTLHRACAYDEDWEVRWFTLDGQLTIPVMSAFGINREGVYTVGTPPIHLFKRLEKHLQDITIYDELAAGTIAYEILGLASKIKSNPKENPLIGYAQTIIKRSLQKQNFSLGNLSVQLGVHRSTLCRTFKETLGVSPMEYLTGLRLQRAVALLKSTTASIKEISYSCGFTDPAYFARIFKKNYSISPREIREQID